MTDGPLKRAFDLLDSDGVLSRELITMRIKNGMLVKEVITRKYSNNDYTDGTSITPICKVEGEK
jgi:hypothetical protein